MNWYVVLLNRIKMLIHLWKIKEGAVFYGKSSAAFLNVLDQSQQN
jgi:hypothetical protein